MKIALIASALLIGSIGVAMAQTPPAGGGGGRGGGLRTACADDITKLCAGKTGADVRTCLTDNKAKVSAACSTAMDAPRGGGGGAGAPAAAP